MEKTRAEEKRLNQIMRKVDDWLYGGFLCNGCGEWIEENDQGFAIIFVDKLSNKLVHAVDKEKFSPVPSDRSWVCYINPRGEITNENIRCILYPQKSGTTSVAEDLTPVPIQI